MKNGRNFAIELPATHKHHIATHGSQKIHNQAMLRNKQL